MKAEIDLYVRVLLETLCHRKLDKLEVWGEIREKYNRALLFYETQNGLTSPSGPDQPYKSISYKGYT